MSNHALAEAAAIIRDCAQAVAFTGAGISVESGIPPFRGPEGLWTKYDPELFDIRQFKARPKESWELIKKLFYDFVAKARPNAAHYALADLERHGRLACVITQNIDNLHQAAGSRLVHEYHGSIRDLVCLKCGARFLAEAVGLDTLPPLCPECGGLLKPDIVFFSEPIPDEVNRTSVQQAQMAGAMIVIGTTGEVMPASRIPYIAKNRGAKIIEINVRESAYTHRTTDIFLEGKASVMTRALAEAVLGG
ncbi:MAG: Sir2 family NAD-dependent protein deacetylase [Desulfovibrionaceae bacterium]|nr:Sir2 family NAD-dependent protein deacetylase [Desulfovibrionaceae bacterium]